MLLGNELTGYLRNPLFLFFARKSSAGLAWPLALLAKLASTSKLAEVAEVAVVVVLSWWCC